MLYPLTRPASRLPGLPPQVSSPNAAPNAAPNAEVLRVAPSRRLAAQTGPLPWVQVAAHSPYFVTETGEPWTPIGHNDAVTWPNLAGARQRTDQAAVDAHFGMLAAQGVTVLRLMLEYCHGDDGYLEQPAGHFQPELVQVWDDLFALAQRHGLRFLLTPYDTFWMWIRWEHHPYNAALGGPIPDRSAWLTCPETRAAIKRRLAFAIDRWGGSGVLFAWDLWNEIHPAHAGDSCTPFGEFIADLSRFVRTRELARYGRSHPQTVSIYGPVLLENRHAEGDLYRHPDLDFATIHLYEAWTIDCPENTVVPALAVGRLVDQALAEIHDGRPFFDSEHGPIHLFKDREVTLPDAFDDEYFRHMQWVHLACGGAGGGMRWPNRHPHALTPGMHAAQQALAAFLPHIDWLHFARRPLTPTLRPDPSSVAAFGCGAARQALLYLLRTDSLGPDGMLRQDAPPQRVCVDVPGLDPGTYRVTLWDTRAGAPLALPGSPAVRTLCHAGGDLTLDCAVVTDVAVAITAAPMQ